MNTITTNELLAAVKLYATLRAEQDAYKAKNHSADYGFGTGIVAPELQAEYQTFKADYLALNQRAVDAEKHLRELGDTLIATPVRAA